MQKFLKLFTVSFFVFISGCSYTSKTTDTKPTYLTESLSLRKTSNWQTQGDTWKNNVIPHDNIVKVAVFLPLSGKASSLGQHLKNAMKIGLLQTNPENVLLTFYDTKSTPLGTKEASLRAKAINPDVILGPVFSKHVQIIKENISNKPILSFTTDPSVLGRGTYSLGITPSNQMISTIKQAQKSGKTRIGLMMPYTQAGQRMTLDAKQTGLVSESIFYKPGDLKEIQAAAKKIANYDFRNQTMKNYKKTIGHGQRTRLKHVETRGEYPYDAIFVGGSGTDLEASVSFLRYFEVDPAKVKYLGTSQWDNAKKPTLKRTRAWVAGIDQISNQRFSALYKSNYGVEPHTLAILGYDSITLIAKFSEDGSLSLYEFLNPNGYLSASGLFRLKENGGSEHALEIRQLSPTEESKLISTAPKNF